MGSIDSSLKSMIQLDSQSAVMPKPTYHYCPCQLFEVDLCILGSGGVTTNSTVCGSELEDGLPYFLSHRDKTPVMLDSSK